jgi:hypothetical protein
MMMKLVTILFAAVLCAAIAACGGGGDDASPAASAPEAPTTTPAPIATRKPTPVITAKPTPTPMLGGSQFAPIPIGQPAVYTDGWTITVLSSVPDATAQVLAFNAANVPPDEGKQFFLATVQVTYSGPEPVTSFGAGFVLRAIGRTYTAYSISSSCGIIPEAFPGTEIAPGGSLTGNVCWAVNEADAENLVMYYKPTAGTNLAVQYSDLTP